MIRHQIIATECLLLASSSIKVIIISIYKEFIINCNTRINLAAENFMAKSLKMRLVGGAWCLVAFVLVTAYSSVLTSFITAPHSLPLVETAEDVAQKPNVNPVTMKSYGADNIITVGLLSKLIQILIRVIFFLAEWRESIVQGRCCQIGFVARVSLPQHKSLRRSGQNGLIRSDHGKLQIFI